MHLVVGVFPEIEMEATHLQGAPGVFHMLLEPEVWITSAEAYQEDQPTVVSTLAAALL